MSQPGHMVHPTSWRSQDVLATSMTRSVSLYVNVGTPGLSKEGPEQDKSTMWRCLGECHCTGKDGFREQQNSGLLQAAVQGQAGNPSQRPRLGTGRLCAYGPTVKPNMLCKKTDLGPQTNKGGAQHEIRSEVSYASDQGSRARERTTEISPTRRTRMVSGPVCVTRPLKRGAGFYNSTPGRGIRPE